MHYHLGQAVLCFVSPAPEIPEKTERLRGSNRSVEIDIFDSDTDSDHDKLTQPELHFHESLGAPRTHGRLLRIHNASAAGSSAGVPSVI